MDDFAKIVVNRETKKTGPRAVFRITADVSRLASVAGVVDGLAEQFLAVVAQLGPRVDCPPDIVLVFTGLQPGDARVNDLKAQLNQMWGHNPRVAEVMREKGNGFPGWAVAFAGAGGAFDTYLSVAAGTFGSVVQDEIRKVVTGNSAEPVAAGAGPASKPWWKVW